MNECKCTKCSYEWKSRKEEPKQCPMCKSYKWREEKKGDD